MTDPEAVILPIVAMAMLTAMVFIVVWYFLQRTKAQARLSDEARAIVQKAIDGQQQLLAETKDLKASLAEVERLLHEV